MACRLLSWLANEERPDLALAVFDWMEPRPDYHTSDRVLYTRLLSIFARQQDGLCRAIEMFDRMRAAGIKPDVVAFNAGVGAAGLLLPPLAATPCRS
jgi:pentatricopeptide repeat protein